MSVRSFKRARARRDEREQRRFAGAKRRTALAAGAALTASALFAANAEAATYTVNTNADDPAGNPCNPSPGTCTLRDAISTSDKDSTADTINFDPSLNGKTIDVAANGALSITHDGGLTIDGPGSGSLTVSGGGSSQVFSISTGSGSPVTIGGLTITDGSSSGAGGAIQNSHADLTLNNDVVSGSTAQDGDGGGVYSDGPLYLNGTTVSDNHAPTAGDIGGGIEVEPKYNSTISNSTITGNSASFGGGIAGGKYLDVVASQIAGNHATSGYGGGIDAVGTSLGLQSTTVSGNTATENGGGIASNTKYGTTITGSALTGNMVSSTYGVGGGLSVTSTHATFGGNDTPKYNPVQVADTTISGNTANAGAGMGVYYAAAGTPITLKASTLSDNHGTGNSYGGGLFLISGIYSPFRVVDSTVSGNSAVKGGGASLGYNGGSPLIGTGSTGRQGSIAFDNSTIAYNTASSSGGGVYLGQYTSGGTKKSGTAGITSTIVSGNYAAGSKQDLARGPASTSGGFNGAFSLIQQPDGAPLTKQSVIVGVSPQLGALGNHGGPTQTMLPSGISPVIDQGHAPHSLSTDQRGAPRTVPINGIKKPPGGDGTDIGAVELSSAQVVANFSASVPGGAIGGSKTPLLAAQKTPVKCTVRTGTLSSCVIQVLGPKGGVLAQGGTATQSPTATSLSPTVRLTAAGVKALKHHPLGVPETIKVFGNTGDDTPTIVGKVQLSKPQFTLALPGSSSKLPRKLRKQLKTIANLLFGAKSATCTGYQPNGGSVSLAKSQAKAACRKLKHDGFQGKVHSHGKTHTGGPQLVITFKY